MNTGSTSSQATQNAHHHRRYKPITRCAVCVVVFATVVVFAVVVGVARSDRVSDVAAVRSIPVSFASTSDENEIRTF